MGKKKDKKTDQQQTDARASQDAAATEDQSSDLLARLQRVTADYLNYQKRAARDMAQARQFANDDIIKSLLGVLDDMERGLEAARENHSEDDPLLVGMTMVHDKMLQTLGTFGLEPISAEGEPFDPDMHAAVMQEPCEDYPSQTVLRELQKGYRLSGRTIRPSSVVVSMQAGPAEQEDEDAEDGESV